MYDGHVNSTPSCAFEFKTQLPVSSLTLDSSALSSLEQEKIIKGRIKNSFLI